MFMKSKYGNAVLMDKSGYVYRSNLKREAKIYWRCRNSEKFKCPARAVTDGFYVLSRFKTFSCFSIVGGFTLILYSLQSL